MAEDRVCETKSAHRLAFDHYLRTGQRLTTAEWTARQERKFNPYHDEIGRFTSPPGVTVSWGAHGEPRSPSVRRTAAESYRSSARRRTASPAASSDRERPAGPKSPEDNGAFRSGFVRNATSQGGNADTYFELNKRQRDLNALRAAAGPRPSVAVAADLDEIQARLDANRLLLDQRAKIADGEIVEAFRAVNPLVDVGAASLHIAQGEGDLDDAITLATNVPWLKPLKLAGGGLAAGLGRGARLAKPFATSKVTKDTAHTLVNGVIQRGGAHRYVKGISKHHSHHIPQKAASRLSKNDGPAIAMEELDHIVLKSSRNFKDVLARQKVFVERGDYRSAMEVEIADIRENFASKYDDAIEQMLSYSRSQGLIR
jgi:hypothetical protein